MLRIILAVLVVGALVTAAVLLLKHKKNLLSKAPTYGLKPRPVHVVASRKGALVEKKAYLAVVEPFRSAAVSCRVTASVEDVRVDEGDVVEQGEVLLTLDCREVKHRMDSTAAHIRQANSELAASMATLDSLERSLSFWRKEMQRDRALAEEGAVTASQAEKTAEKVSEMAGRHESARRQSEAITHRVASLESLKAELETKLGYCSVKSPYAGVVTERAADPGDLAVPGRLLIRVEDHAALKVAFDVPQKDLPAMSTGLGVRFACGDELREAQITMLHPTLNRAHMKRVEAWLRGDAAKGLSAGAYIPVDVVMRELDNVTLVPRLSLIESPAGACHVFCLHEETLKAQPVALLGFDGDNAAVSGLQPGVAIVQNTFLGWTRLSAGEPVEAVR